MGDNEKQPGETEGVTVDEPTEPVLNPEDEDLDSSQGTPGGEESPESAD